MDIYQQAEKIRNQQDFIDFLKTLKRSYKENPNEWENDNLTSFLEGLDGYSSDMSQGEVSWKIFAEILLAARVYE